MARKIGTGDTGKLTKPTPAAFGSSERLRRISEFRSRIKQNRRATPPTLGVPDTGYSVISVTYGQYRVRHPSDFRWILDH